MFLKSKRTVLVARVASGDMRRLPMTSWDESNLAPLALPERRMSPDRYLRKIYVQGDRIMLAVVWLMCLN